MNRGILPSRRIRPNDQWEWYDPLVANPTTGGMFTESKTSGVNGITMQDAHGGVAFLDPTHGTPAANQEDNIYTTKKCFDWADGTIMGFEGRYKLSQSNTNKLQFGHLITSVAATGALLNGGGINASFSGAGIYTTVGDTVFYCCSSIGGTQTTTASTTTAATSGAWVTLRVEIECVSTTLAVATFSVNGAQLQDTNGLPIKHVFTYTGAAKAGALISAKNGSSTPEVGVYVDDVAVYGNNFQT